MPAQLPFLPYDVTPATMFVPARKFGPPESPKQVPPVLELLDSCIAKSPTNPGTLIWTSFGWEIIRVRTATSCFGFGPAS